MADLTSGPITGPRFSSDNNSSNSAKSSDQKNSSEEYYYIEREEDQEGNDFRQSEFVDRSAQLKATLNSLAMLNVAGMIRHKNQKNNASNPINRK